MLQNQVDELRALLDVKLRAKGRTLDRQVRRAGRRLPRHIRKDAQSIVAAMGLIQNPKLARMVDQVEVSKAAQRVVDHLKTIDPMDRFKGRVLGILGTISAILIVTFILVVYVLVKRGLI